LRRSPSSSESSRLPAPRSSFDVREALCRRLTVHGLAIRAHVSAERLRHLSTSHSDDGRDPLSTITRRTTKSCRLSADLFGGSPRSPFDDRRPTFTASILFRRSSPLITVSNLPLKSCCRITAGDPLSRTTAAPLRFISDHLSMILDDAHRDPRRARILFRRCVVVPPRHHVPCSSFDDHARARPTAPSCRSSLLESSHT
jgi:hypothetical protein